MSRGRILAAIAFGVVGVAILLVLGFWQVQRLAQKEALIAEIEARLAADPVALPQGPDPARDRLLRVAATGRIGPEELHVLSSVRPWGAGYRIVSPMTLPDGRRILVDLGFVPQGMKDPAARPAQARNDPARAPETVTGPLYWPLETDSYTPEPDLARNIWFGRDVDAMATALSTEPVLLIAESHPRPEWPRPQPPGADLPNRHLEYAITWFGLAVAWAVMTALFVRTHGRSRPPST